MLPHHACHRLVSGLALLLVAVFNVGIALAEEQDVLFYNGRVFTADPEHPYAEAVAIRGERIVGVGALADVTRQIGPAARRVDLGQHFLMPGMIDAHAHPIYGGLQLNQLRYSAEDGSIPNLVAFVGSKLPGVGADQVLIVNDLDIRIWSQAAAIDDALSHGAFAQRRIVLYGNDGHTAWANAQARLKAGLTPDFLKHLPDSQRRFYGHDQHFNPNGFVVDAGKSRLMASLPPVFRAEEFELLDQIHSVRIKKHMTVQMLAARRRREEPNIEDFVRSCERVNENIDLARGAIANAIRASKKASQKKGAKPQSIKRKRHHLAEDGG